MPTYRITTPQGDFDIEADREPTNEEALAAIGGQASPKHDPVTSLAGAERSAANGRPPVTRPEFSAGDFMDKTRGDLDRQMKTMGRVGLAASPMLVPGFGPAAMLGRAAVGGGAYLTDRAIEGEEPKMSEMAKTMVLSGAPIPKPGAANLFSLGGLANVAKGAGAATAAVAAGNAVEQGIARVEDDQALSWDRYKQSMREATIPAVIGATALWGGGKLQSMAKVQSEVDAARKAAEELGMQDAMLGDLVPKRYGEMQQRIVAANSAMMAKQNEARSPLAKAMFATAADAPPNEAIASALQPVIGKIDQLDGAYAQAEARLVAAQDAVVKAKAAAQLDPKVRADIIRGAQADTMAAITEQAKTTIAASTLADRIGTQTGHAEALQDVVGKTFKARSEIANEMMAATGIPQDAAIIGQQSLLKAAEAALGPDAKTLAGKSILETIKTWGSKTAEEAVATKALSFDQLMRKAAETGVQPTPAEIAAATGGVRGQLVKNGQVVAPTPVAQGAAAVSPEAEKFLTLDDFRRLRDGISDGFFGKVESNNMNNAERLAAKAYHAMSDAHVGEIGKLFPEAVGPYNQFRQFWRETSKIRDSDFGRALLRGEVADSTVASMANKLATGQVDEIKNFKQLIDTIKPMNPAVADAAMATMGSAVGNSFRQAAYDAASGGVDYRKLFNTVNAAASKTDFPFPVEQFGFGSRETIAGAQKALRQFKPEELTPENLRVVFDSPQIRGAMQVGGKDVPEQITRFAATRAYTKRVNDAIALREAGLIQPARQAFVDANGLAKRAGMDAAQAAAEVRAAEANPLTSVFRGKGGYRLTNEAEKIGGHGTVTDLVANLRRDEARSFMGKLAEEKPDLHELVKRRLVANALEDMTAPGRTMAGEVHTVNTQKMREFFSPTATGSPDTRFDTLRAAIGAEDAAKLKKIADYMMKMQDAERTAKIGARIPNLAEESLAVGSLATSGSIQQARSRQSLLKQFNNWAREKRFDLASAMLLDDGLLNAFSRNSGDIAATLSSLPAQKSYLLLQDARFLRDVGNDKSKDQPKP